MGELTEGSIELGNQDVKKTDRRFVTRVSGERIQKDNLIRRLWKLDPVHYYEDTVNFLLQFTEIKRLFFVDTKNRGY